MLSNRFTAYLFARISVGMSFFGHGLVRLPKVEAFASGMVKNFEDTLLPSWIVKPFAVALPYFELLMGGLLLLGLLTRLSLNAGAVLMLILIFGSCLLENWSGVGTQLFYSFFFATLIAFYEYNRYSIDYRLGLG